MRTVFALAMKDIRLLVRDKSGFFFTFFFPMIVAVFFGAIFSGSSGKGPQSIPILVVDEDRTVESAEFISLLAASDELRIELTTRDEAIEKVRLGSSVAFVALKAGFGDARKNIFWGSPPEIEIGVDPSRKSTAGMLQGILMKYGVQGFQKTFSNPLLMRSNISEAIPEVKESPDMDPVMKTRFLGFLTELDGFMEYLDKEVTERAGERSGNAVTGEPVPGVPAIRDPDGHAGGETDAAGPDLGTSDGEGFSGFMPLNIRTTDVVRERTGPRSGYEVSFPQGIMWGIIGCAASFGISLVVERTRGTLVRLLSAPISLLQILAGKGLACLLTTLAISAGLILLAVLVFHVELHSLPLMIMALLSICGGFVGIMMLLSVLGKTERSAGGIGWAVLMVMSMLGGGMIPLFIMPRWMQSLSTISPVKWAMLAMEGAIWRRFTFAEMLLPCAIILGFGIVSFSVGVSLFRKTVQN